MNGTGYSESLGTLILGSAEGDVASLRRLYEQHAPRLFGVALRIVRNRPLAADVIQDAFLQIWQKAATFDPDRGSAEAWLVSIVRYRALDAIRRQAREVLSDDPGLGDGADSIDPVALLSERRDGARLRKCLQELDEKNRRAIVLAFVNGLSHAEVATRIAAPLGTIKAWIRRGLISLKGCLQT